jgi:hypothetical protein
VADTVCVKHVVFFFFLNTLQLVSKTNLQVITSNVWNVPDHEHDHKRVFLSEEKDDNLVGSIISKVNITYVGPNVSASLILSS